MPRTLVIGDVHGCADPLARLLKKVDPDRVILVGDLFTRGPDPRGVWKLIRRYDAEAVLGNRDLEVLRHWTPGDRLSRKAFRWLEGLPMRIDGKSLDGQRWSVVHAGVHPFRGPRRTKPSMAMQIRRYNLGSGQAPYWWKLYRGKRLVIHGHTYRSTPILHLPYTVGLDTGCVRGGRLTGYVLEEQRCYSVAGQRMGPLF